MSTAFSAVYPPDRSLPARMLAPMADPRAYLRALHLLLMFPLGLAYFVFFVVTLSFGGALVWTFIGPPVLLLAMFVSLWIGDLEAGLVNFVTQSDIHRPPKVLEGVTSLREKVWSRIIDPSTWTGLLYALVQFPLGVGAFVFVVVAFSVAAALIASPLLIAFGDETIEFGADGGLVLDHPVEALPFVVLGLLCWLLTMHLTIVFSTVHAGWARLMLGSRGRRPPAPVSPESGPPAPGEPPRLLLPPAGSLGDEGVEPLEALRNQVEDPPVTTDDRVIEHPALQLLTAREREVAKLLARGYSNADICEACYISEGTVKTHVRNILGKLDLRDRTQVAVFAYESGLVRPGAWRERYG